MVSGVFFDGAATAFIHARTFGEATQSTQGNGSAIGGRANGAAGHPTGRRCARLRATVGGTACRVLSSRRSPGQAKHPETCFICGCFRAEGCFPPGVKITMADGSLRNIEDVRAGDMVRNAKTGAPVKVGKVIEGPEALPLIRFGFEGTTVTTSQAHPVLTAAGLKPANQLKKGDTVFDAQGNPHPLTILETLPIEEGQRVINVNLDAASSDADERLLISDGIITGDIVLQGLLKERK